MAESALRLLQDIGMAVKSLVYLAKKNLETQQRLEHKVDSILRVMQKTHDARNLPTMGYSSLVDPVSQQPVTWKTVTLSDGSKVVERIGSGYNRPQ